MKFKRRHGEFEQGCVLSERYTATDALPLILPACRQPLLPACVFVTRDTVHHPRLFSGKVVREPICSWTKVTLYVISELCLKHSHMKCNWQHLGSHMLWMTIHTAQSLQEQRIIIINIRPYKVGVFKSWGLVTQMTNFCIVVPITFGIIIVYFS
jgi:hypothetical protein